MILGWSPEVAIYPRISSAIFPGFARLPGIRFPYG